jgi:DNA invertase Pin-like site-specific DNA recombinase
VIDEDLGHSASGADARPGFQHLVSEVGLDHVGIVLGIEMSCLARTGREWHQLLELCALSGPCSRIRTVSMTPLITTTVSCWV